MTPPKVTEPLSVPVVSVPLIVIVPLLVRTSRVSAPPMMSIAPVPTSTEELLVRMLLPTVVSVPAEIVVVPVKSLAPDSVTEPLVVLVRLPAPDSLAETVPAWKA